MNWSMRRWSLGGTQSSALNSPEARSPRGTWAATRDGRSETSKDWIARMPDSPANSRPQTFSRPMPSGLTRPMPVMTMRLIGAPFPYGAGEDEGGPGRDAPGALECDARSAMRLDKADRVLDRNDLLGGGVRDVAAERVLGSD